MKLKAILRIWLIITKQLKIAGVVATSTNSNWWFSPNR